MLLLACLSVWVGITAAAESPVERRWHGHIEALANDAMRGRQTGSPEHLKAAEYVAAQFKALGLEPAGGHGSYLQPVNFAWRRIDEPNSSIALVFGDRVDRLVLGTEAIILMGIDEPDSLEAPLVFAGYGISVPELGYDDFASVDVRGKVVVYLNGAPASVPDPRRAHAQSGAERWASMKQRGALGVIAIRNPHRAEGTWEQNAAQRFTPGMSLADPDVDERQGQRLSLSVNSATAQKWFEGSGHTFAEVLALADSGAALPAFDLAPRVRARVRYERRTVVSQNVVARLPGRDSSLAKEFVVLTAHLDHLGVGAPVEGDSIFNGAFDNASGVATLIETARALAPRAMRPKRSLLFLVVTGEEKGLLGSYFWTKRPTVPVGQVVAAVNADMVLPIVPFDHTQIHGIDESTIGDDARAEAAASGIIVVADPEPQRNRFIRSDQFSFVRAGIPAVGLWAGATPGSPADSLIHAWLRTRYHQPSDDLAQRVEPGAPAATIGYLARLTARIANAPARPQWKAQSFFRRFATTP